MAAFGALPAGLRGWLVALSSPEGGCSAPPLAPQPADSRALYAALVRHRTAPLALRRAEQYAVPAELSDLLRNAQADNIARAFASVSHVSALADAFGRRGITWCVLKGVPLALRTYGDLAARHVGDIDVLVHPLQADLADDVLRTHSWLPAATAPMPRFWHERRYVEPGGMSLELHRRVHPNPTLLPLPTATLLDRCEAIDIGGAQIPVLEPSTELLYLATHGSRHGWYRLQWVCDIAVIAAQKAPELIERAREEAARLGVLKPLAQSLLLAQSLFGVPAPTWARTLERQSAGVRALLRFAEETLWCPRSPNGDPVERDRSSLLNALHQRAAPNFWLWELALRAQHEWQQWRAAQ